HQQPNTAVAVATLQQRRQNIHALIPTLLHHDLQRLLEGGERRVESWYRRLHLIEVDFSDALPCFHHYNTLPPQN
ncbi:MAG: molybdenum cofactor guanylyltransferase MobA, partial [Gammaproteobacteria bacterium]|nr:molybdenum cofactor guanylyltransferase MobA [Gammaproteobacteria bacterium]